MIEGCVEVVVVSVKAAAMIDRSLDSVEAGSWFSSETTCFIYLRADPNPSTAASRSQRYTVFGRTLIAHTARHCPTQPNLPCPLVR